MNPVTSDSFDQPAAKARRRAARDAKAKRIAPRPLDLLRPIVRGQTNKYNMRIRPGRGFSLDELKAAKIRRKEALTIGIPVDYRRRNRSEESYQLNVARLKMYRSKLILFPRKPTSQRQKKGDSTADEIKTAQQVETPNVLAIDGHAPHTRARKIAPAEVKADVFAVLRKARSDMRLKGIREKRAKDKAEGKSKGDKKKKAADEGDDGMEE